MDENEFRLLSALRKDARISLLALARELNMPPSTVHDKVKRYSGNIVTRHAALLNFTRLGYVRSCLVIRTTQAGRQRVQGFLANYPGLNNLHKIDSGYDFLAEIVGRDQKEIEDFIASLKEVVGVLDVQKFMMIEDLIKESFEPKFK